MITIRLTNRQAFIEGASRKTLRALDAVASYGVSGAQFSSAFKAHRWDGREHLLKFSAKHGYHAPSGLILDILRVLKQRKLEYVLKDETAVRGKRRVLKWNPEVVLRDYQARAVERALSGPIPGMGILKLPIRSGKTVTAAKIIKRLGFKTLFVVPSQMLLNQTVEALQRALPDAEIGRIGDGNFEIGRDITVATIQSLQRLQTSAKSKRVDRPKWKVFVQEFDVLICDEAHHFGGSSSWHSVLYAFDCRFKIALSATVFMKSETQIELGIIWIRAIFGPIRINISTSALVERGFLMRQNVEIHTIKEPNLHGQRWSQSLRRDAIHQNKARNEVIARLTSEHAGMGRRVLIIANRLDHIAALSDCLDDVGLDYRVITGRDNSESRESKLDSFRNGDCNVLLGTVLSEGVDVPSIETVINAEGGVSDISTVQRQRNLTTATGKADAVLIDFYDKMNKYFRRHSEARLEAYRSESAFKVSIIG